MRTLLSTLTLLSLSGCLSAKQGDALEKDSHETAAQTTATSSQYADALAKEEARQWAFEGSEAEVTAPDTTGQPDAAARPQKAKPQKGLALTLQAEPSAQDEALPMPAPTGGIRGNAVMGGGRIGDIAAAHRKGHRMGHRPMQRVARVPHSPRRLPRLTTPERSTEEYTDLSLIHISEPTRPY